VVLQWCYRGVTTVLQWCHSAVPDVAAVTVVVGRTPIHRGVSHSPSVVWCSVVWCGVVCCGMLWYDTLRCVVVGMVISRHVVVCCGVLYLVVLWYVAVGYTDSRFRMLSCDTRLKQRSCACYSGVKVVLQWCYSSVTVELE
jgi:hypothetical protein